MVDFPASPPVGGGVGGGTLGIRLVGIARGVGRGRPASGTSGRRPVVGVQGGNICIAWCLSKKYVHVVKYKLHVYKIEAGYRNKFMLFTVPPE